MCCRWKQDFSRGYQWCRFCPFLPLRLSYHYPSCPAPFRARCVAIWLTPCAAHSPFFVFFSSGRACSTTVRGISIYGRPRGILSPAVAYFSTCMRLHQSARATPNIRWLRSESLRACYTTRCMACSPAPSLTPFPCRLPFVYLVPLGPSLSALPATRMVHNNVRGTRFSLCPDLVCRYAHGAVQPFGLLGPFVVPPLVALCPVLSSSLSSCARTVPSFPLLLCPIPTPSVPLSPGHGARQCAVHDTHLFSGWLHCPPHFGRLPGPLLAPSFSSHAPLARFCACLCRPNLHCFGWGQRHCAHYTRHVAHHAPLGPLYPSSLPLLVARPSCAVCPLAPLCVPSLPCARYATMYGAPAALALLLLALVRPRALALFLLLLPPPVRARCRALCMASTFSLFAPLRRLSFLGPSVLPALARS